MSFFLLRGISNRSLRLIIVLFCTYPVYCVEQN
jgi:hypothetical protein